MAKAGLASSGGGGGRAGPGAGDVVPAEGAGGSLLLTPAVRRGGRTQASTFPGETRNLVCRGLK